MTNTAMRKHLWPSAVVLALASPLAIATDLFYENFNTGIPIGPCPVQGYPGGAGTYPFPAGWTLFNVDGHTPDAQVAYINEAWEDREDFQSNVTECVAFSTSYYSPPDQADDWMWSPPIVLTAGAALSWRAAAYDPAYPDGYEVRVKTGAAPTQANQTSSDVVFSVAAEQSPWVAHTVDMSTYGGQTVYVGFRNNSTDKYILVIDDVRVKDNSPDLAAVAPGFPFASEYARAPLGMDIMPTLAINAYNAGAVELTNVIGVATPKLDGSAGGAGVATTTPVATLALGALTPLTFDAQAPYSGPGVWTTSYSVSADQTEPDLANNIIDVPGTTIGGNELARWEGDVTGTLGIGAGNGGELGVSLTIPADGFFAGAHFAMLPIPPDDGMVPPTPNVCPGFDYVLNLRSFDTVNNIPGDIIDTTTPIPCEYNMGGSYEVAFVQGQHFLPAGTYVLTAVEAVGGPTLTLPLHTQRFVAATTWVNWPTNPVGQWAHNEDFGSAFQKTFELSLLQGEQPIFANGFEDSATSGQPRQSFRTVRRAPPAVVKGTPTRAIQPVQFAPRTR
jgi:hypothetical protein